MDPITASRETLLRQSGMTASDQMDDAIRYIDEKFGKGYAKEHPELIAAFMNAAAQDNAAMNFAKSHEEAMHEIASAIELGLRKLADKLDTVNTAR